MGQLEIKRFLVAAAATLAALTMLPRADATDGILFEDSFDAGLTLWTVASGDWTTSEGRLEGGGPRFSELKTFRAFDGDLIVEFMAATVPPANHDIQCGLFDNGYTLVLGAEFNAGAALRRHGALAAWANFAIEPGRQYAVTIMRRAGVIECLVNGRLLLSWIDPEPIASGPISLRTWDAKIAFDAIRVRRFPKTPRIVVTDASTKAPLGPEAVARLRAGGGGASGQVALVPGSSRLEPTFALRAPGGAYHVTFVGYPTQHLGEYDECDWFNLYFAGQPALRVRAQNIGSQRTPEYARAAGITTPPVSKGSSVFIDVVGTAAQRTAGTLELFYGPKGARPKRIATQSVALGTTSTPLLSHTLELEAEGPGTYWVTAQLTVGQAVVARAGAPFHVMAPSELLDAGDGFRLRRAGFVVDVDKRTGTIKGLFNDVDERGTNYVANETNCAEFALRDTRFFGDVVVTSRLQGMPWRQESTSRSADVRRVSSHKGGVLVSYAAKSKTALGGFQHVNLWEWVGVDAASRTLTWDIALRNTFSFPLEVGEIALPLLVNDTFFDVGGSQEMAHTHRVFAFPHAGGHSGFVLVQRLSGEPPYLLIVPADGTAFEAVGRSLDYHYRPRGPEWSGLHSLYLVSKATAERQHWRSALNPPTSTTIRPGEQQRFGVRMVWINNLSEIPATLFQLGKVAVQVAPGMVVPTNQTASLLCWSKKPIRNVQPLDPGITIADSSSRENATLYTLRFDSEGPKRLRLFTGPDEWTTVAFYAVAPIERLIDARAAFIAERQFYRDPDDPHGRDYGFLPWDRAERAVVEKIDNASAIIGCSDLGGFADPLFLAAKNVYRPDEEQIQTLEQYVEHCLFKRVQDPETYRIRASLYTGVEGAWSEDAARDWSQTHNYALALTIYYDLYRIGTLYGLTTLREPKQYLEMAANTAIAMFDQTRWHNDGHVGGATVIDVLDALQREEMFDKHADLLARAKVCVESLEKRAFPYGGATVYAPTSYAQVYHLWRYFEYEDRAEQALRVMLAARGKQPVWTEYGNDRQWWHFDGYGRWRTQEEVGLFYSSAVNGATLLDAYERLGDRHLLTLGYAGVLSPWPLVGKTGDGSTGYHVDPWASEFEPVSTAGAIGLWGALGGLGSYLVRDRDFGLLGFGCDVSASGGYTIVPKDGLYKRAYFQPVGVGVEISVGRLTKIASSENGTKLWIAFTVEKPFEKHTTITLSGLRAGRYHVTVNGTTDDARIDAAVMSLPPVATKSGANLVIIERIEEPSPDDDGQN